MRHFDVLTILTTTFKANRFPCLCPPTTYPTILKQNDVKKHLKMVEDRDNKRKKKNWKIVQYLGFSFLSIIAAATVLCLLLHSNDCFEETEETKNETTSTSNSCSVWEIVGDGYCDDEANKPECGYDYHDCCQQESDRSFCTNCTCHLPEDVVQLFLDQSKSPSCLDGLHLDEPLYFEAFFPELSLNEGGPGSHHLGDGVCNYDFNKDKYFFDIGDCCLHSEDDEEIKIRIGADYVEIDQDPCIRSNNFCIAEELGDGLCQDHNNGPYCDYDLGDCCMPNNHHLNMSDLKDCCACFCRTFSPSYFG